MITAFASGRVELLGNHTDYNEGHVLAATLDRGVTMRGRPRDDGLVVLASNALGETFSGSLDELPPSRERPWANYVIGVIDQLQRRGVDGLGFEATISSDLPIGAGLSSSAALECAAARFLQDLWRTDLPTLELARIAQAAEHEYAGVECGLLDQIAALFGEPGTLVCVDFRTFEVDQLAMPPGARRVVAPSGAAHELSGGAYNERRAACEAAARALGARALRDVDVSMVRRATSLTPLQRRRALHVVSENERVDLAHGLIRRGDVAGLGELLDQSHESSRVYFENSCDELDLLVELARAIEGCLGARLTGGGFGGSTVNLVRADQVEPFSRELAAAYERRTGHAIEVFVL